MGYLVRCKQTCYSSSLSLSSSSLTLRFSLHRQFSKCGSLTFLPESEDSQWLLLSFMSGWLGQCYMDWFALILGQSLVSHLPTDRFYEGHLLHSCHLVYEFICNLHHVPFPVWSCLLQFPSLPGKVNVILWLCRWLPHTW